MNDTMTFNLNNSVEIPALADVAQNIDVFDFTLSADELVAIDTLDRGVRGGPDPSSSSEPYGCPCSCLVRELSGLRDLEVPGRGIDLVRDEGPGKDHDLHLGDLR